MIERVMAGAAGTLAFCLIAVCGNTVCQRVMLVALGWRNAIEHYAAWSN